MSINPDRSGPPRGPRGIRRMLVCASGLLAVSAIAPAQTPAPPTAPPTTKSAEPPTAKTHPNDPMIWDAEQMMEEAVIQITRHYNLTKAQEDYTRLLLKTKVRAFLDEYDMQVRELLAESIDLQRHPEKATPERLMDWALRAGPVYEAAKKAILEGNDTWREILDPDQIRIHDQDLRLMTANFANVTEKLQSWQRGEGKMAAGRTARPSPRAIDNTRGRVSDPSGGAVRSIQIEDQWGAYVSRFIRAYHLDKAQQNAAREGILKEQLVKAASYREQKKAAFKDIERKMTLKGTKVDRKEQMRRLTNLNRRRRALEQPIRELFVELDERLNVLPRSEQRANVDPDLRQDLDRLYKTLAGREKPGSSVSEGPAKKAPPVDPATPPKPDSGEAKPSESKPEAKPDAKPDPKPETKSDAKAEAKP